MFGKVINSYLVKKAVENYLTVSVSVLVCVGEYRVVTPTELQILVSAFDLRHNGVHIIYV